MLHTAATSYSYATARRIGRALRAVGVTVCSVAVLHACDNPPAPVEPATPQNATPESRVLGNVTVGTTLDRPVRVTVIGTDGQPLAGEKVRWQPSEDGKVSLAESTTDSKGVAIVRWTVGTKVGDQALVAYVAGVQPVVFSATAVADRAALVRLSSDLIRVTIIGDTVRFSTTVEDQYGNSVSTPVSVSLESSGDVLLVSGSSFIAKNRGNAVIRAAADTATSRLLVLVDPSPPLVTRVLPDTLRPGGTVVVEGLGFSSLPETIELTVAGLRANVLSATSTRIEAQLPNSYPCGATAAQPVRVTVAGAFGEAAVPLRTSTRLQLNKGESAQLLDAQQVRCTELAAPPGNGQARYVVAVINTSQSTASTAAFELRGTGTGGLAGRAAATRSEASAQARSTAFGDAASVLSKVRPRPRGMVIGVDDAAASAAHDQYLRTQRAISARFGSPAPEWRQRTKPQTAALSMAAALGDTVTMKALYASCTSGRDVRARVVYAGTRAVVLEDIAASQAGTMDIEYQRIGDEYDRVQYPLMVENVGDPLAMNATMGGDGRVAILFTRYVNDSLPGIAGYVSACNFYPKSTFPASNQDEVIYGRVANAAEAPSEWRRVMRGTVLHESKHLASFSIRFVDGTPFEESWLEESTGRVAEELYARTFSRVNLWKTNASFEQTVGCELAQCDDRPLMMWKHFSVLHQYLRGVDTLTPLGSTTGSDFTYYASGWSFVRWAIDQYASNEGAWLKAIVRGGQLTGLSNLAQRTGRPVGEMLADWALAQAVDDLPGFTPTRQQLSLPSWNQNEVFSGLAATFPSAFDRRPLKQRSMSFGAFLIPVGRLRAFSTSYFSFDGAQTGSQLLELRGEGGAAVAPASLRVAVVRVE